MPGQVAGTDDGVIDVVGDAELAQLPLHRIRRPRRVGDQDDGAALVAKRMQRLAGFAETTPRRCAPRPRCRSGRRRRRQRGRADARRIATGHRSGLPVSPGRRRVAPVPHCRWCGPARSAAFPSLAAWPGHWRPAEPDRRRFARRRMRASGRSGRGAREQESLAETHVVIEQVDHRAFAFDPLGDQVDAEAAEQIRQVGGLDVGRRRLFLIEQQRGRNLDVADAAIGQFARVDPQIGDVVDREAEAALTPAPPDARFRPAPACGTCSA